MLTIETQDDTNKAVNVLRQKIKEAMDIVAPVETKTVEKKPIDQWTTQGLKVSIITTEKLYQKLLSSQTRRKHLKYKKLL